MKSKALDAMVAPDILPDGDMRGFLADMLDTMYEGILVHQDGRIIFANRAVAAMLGEESSQQLLGKRVLEYLHPDDRPQAIERISGMVSGALSRVEPLLYRVIKRDGSLFYAEVQASRMASDAPRMLVAIRDVTEQHRYKQELEQVQQIVDQAEDPIYATDLEGRFILLNRATERLLKLPREQLLGQSFVPFIAEGNLPMVQEEFQRKLRGEIASSVYEMEIVDSEGNHHSMENHSSIVLDANGEKLGVQGVLRDLARRKRNMARIQMLSQALEYVEEAIMITDRDGVVCHLNKKACAFLGLENQQAIGRYAAELRGGKCDDAQYKEILARLNRGETWSKVMELPAADGTTRTVARVVSPIPDAEGNTQYHACVDRDITEQLRQQRQLEHVQRLESLGVLAGGIAHDFNNILTAIVGNATMAEKKLQRDPLEARNHLVRISQSTERAAVLCRQMLAYSGKGKFIIKRIDLSDEVRSMASLLEVSLHKQVTLRLELADALPPVNADESQLQQLIMNLITNANEAIDGAGTIVLRTGMMRPDKAWLRQCVRADRQSAKEREYLFLQVEDDGCGMDEATQQKIFEPFFTTKFTGRGLGMSALLGIVRGHHGHIHLASTPGKGTTFTILLPPAEPLTEDQQSAAEEPAGNYTLPASATVLVVDDEPDILEAAQAMLEDAGLATLGAADGEAAIACYRQHANEIAAVVLDLTMPRMDGEAALKELLHLDPELPILIASGYASSELKKRFAGHRVAGFLSKPYSQQQLCHAVGKALSGDG